MRILALGNCRLDRLLGSGKTRLMWADGLRGRGHSVETLEPADFEVFAKVSKGRKFRQAIGAWLHLSRRRLDQIDLIEFYGDEFWLATRQLARRKARPFLVAHTDGLELLAAERAQATFSPEAEPSIFRKVVSKVTHERFSPIAFRDADGFVTGSSLDRQYLIERGFFLADRTKVVPPGVDVEFLTSATNKERANQVVYFGTWTERKGLREIKTVMNDLLSVRQNLRFEIIGASNSERQILQSFHNSLHHRITVHPRLSNQCIATVLSKCGILFFPSLYEGFGMALAEALACGCAAVTTPTGFGGELLDGAEALVCQFGDVVAMRNAIVRLLENDELRLRIAKAGQRRARLLRWESSVSSLEETYLRWIEEGACR